MEDLIERPSGLVLSAKTFKPLLIFSWTCSIWRQMPFRTAIATIAFKGKSDAETGHREIVDLLWKLEIKPDMSNVFTVLKEYATQRQGAGVKSFRIYPGSEVEGKITMSVARPEDAA